LKSKTFSNGKSKKKQKKFGGWQHFSIFALVRKIVFFRFGVRRKPLRLRPISRETIEKQLFQPVAGS